MGLMDKVEHKIEEFTGKAKEHKGRHTDDTALEAEGRTDQSKANLKQAGDDVKDAFKT